MNKLEGSLTDLLTETLMGIIKKSQPGDLFPPELELSKKYKVCRNTIREAIRNLVEEGYLYRAQGKGTFITKQKIPFPATTKLDVDAAILDCGYNPGSRLLSIYSLYADETDFLPKRLNLKPEDGVWACEFVRTVNNIPLIFTTTYLSMDTFPDLDKNIVESIPLYETLSKVYNFKEIKKEFYTLESSIPKKEDMKALCIPKSIPIFILKSRTVDNSGTIIDYRISKSRSDMIKFKFNS